MSYEPSEPRMPLAFEKMTPEQRVAALKYKAKVQRMDAIPSRTNKLLGLAGWGSAIGEFCTAEAWA